MKKNILLFFISIATSASSQIPGYYGKHFTIGYSLETQPSELGPTAKHSIGGDRDIEINAVTSTKFLGFNFSHSIFIDGVIGLHTSIGCGYQHFQTGVDYRKNYAQYITFVGDNTIPELCISNNFSLNIKFYQRKFIAPLGRYSRLEVMLLNFKVKYDTSKFTENIPPGYTSNDQLGNGISKGKTIALSYTLGKTRIFFDKLVIDWGIRVGIVPGVFPALWNKYGGLNVETNVKNDAILRLHRYEMFNFHIGIGFLAF